MAVVHAVCGLLECIAAAALPAVPAALGGVARDVEKPYNGCKAFSASRATPPQSVTSPPASAVASRRPSLL